MTDNNTTTLKMTTTPQTKKIKQKKVTIVHCWSAPRSRSTALLYSFEARGCTPTTTNTTGGSTVALDEPLYTTWLRAQGDAVSRPYLTNLLEGRAPPVPNDTKSTNDTNTTNDDTTKHHKQNQNQNEERNEQERMQWEREQLTFDQRLAHAIARLPPDGGTIFCKQMAKFCTVYDFSHEYSGDTGTADDDVDAGGTAGNTATAPAVSSSSSATNTMVKEELQVVHKHVLLIRDPVAVLASWGAAGDVHGNNPTIQEVGIVPLLSIYSTLQSRRTAVAAAAAANEDAAAKEEDEPVGVVVLDSDDLAADPVGSLQALCAELEIVYTDSM